MRGTRERGGTARQSYYGCWSIEASIQVAGNRLRVERGRTQLTVGVASALCVTIDVINYRWSAGFHRNWWIWMNFGTGGWSSMLCVKHRFSSMISFTDDVALFIDVFTWFHRWFFPFGIRWVVQSEYETEALIVVIDQCKWYWYSIKIPMHLLYSSFQLNICRARNAK